MPTKRAVLAELTRAVLRAGLDRYELAIDDRRVKAQLVDALARSRKSRLDEMVLRLSRNRVKELCRVFGCCSSVSPSETAESESSARAPPRSGNDMTMNTTPNPFDASDGLRTEYDLDYGQSRRNRFASWMSGTTLAVVLEPDVARVFDSSEAGEPSAPLGDFGPAEPRIPGCLRRIMTRSSLTTIPPVRPPFRPDHLRKYEQDRLIERFKDHADPLPILVICDMLLTGFDAPACWRNSGRGDEAHHPLVLPGGHDGSDLVAFLPGQPDRQRLGLRDRCCPRRSTRCSCT